MDTSETKQGQGPLEGLKVLDFSSLLPGPYATMLLADMGAEVVRIESPSHSDMVCDVPPFINIDGHQTSYAHLQLNRNKQSIALDLKQPIAIDAVKKMLPLFDVVIEQFRPGVMQKLGLDYKSLAESYPELIYCSISGYGQSGPMVDKAGHDINYLALSGVASYSGTPETGSVLSGVQIADIAGGSHHAVMAIMAAYIARQKSGKGQYLDISMTDAAFSLNALFAPGAINSGTSPELGGTLLNGGHFYGYYQTEGKQQLAVGALEPKFAMRFLALLGIDQSMMMPIASMTELKQQIAERIQQQPLEHWQSLFESEDVCVTPVLDINEAATSLLMKERDMLLSVGNKEQKVSQIAPAMKFAESDFEQFTLAPRAGQGTEALLRRYGVAESDIETILAANAGKESSE
ncbi:CoA transferase [Alteromonadaceae bacterium M269]|nr:CoA transferase [Alteromonadaceae bacterium M269]